MGEEVSQAAPLRRNWLCPARSCLPHHLERCKPSVFPGVGCTSTACPACQAACWLAPRPCTVLTQVPKHRACHLELPLASTASPSVLFRYRNSLCKTGAHFVGRPVRREITENYTEDKYEARPDNIKVRDCMSQSVCCCNGW